MRRKAFTRTLGGYEVKISVSGPCAQEVVNLAEFFKKATEIKFRDLPVEDDTKPKKPCGCSGS